MKNLIFCAALIILSISLTSACISFPTLITNNKNISFSANYHNESKVVEILNPLKLTANDVEVLKNFVINGYSVIEQTDEEYEDFFENAESLNERKGCGSYYIAVSRNGSWTGYIYDLKFKDEEGNYCSIPRCTGAEGKIKWNNLRNSSIDDSINSSEDKCDNLYYIDNENKNCNQKKFCGLYMYEGLQTFENKSDCIKIINPKANCFNDSDCPQEDCFEEDCIGSVISSCIGGECIKDRSNGRKAEIKIMPETASAKAIERLGELNFTVELKEVGKDNNTRAIYEFSGNKTGKFLGIFKIIAKVQVQVDSESGNVKVIKPWWSFLASGI